MSAANRQGRLWLGAAAVTTLLVVLMLNLPTSPVATGGVALRVQMDPETGEFVPVTGLDKAELDRQMKQQLNRSTDGLQEVHHPDGRVSVDLEGRFQSLSVATTDSAGNVRTGCVSTTSELDQFMNADDAQHRDGR